MSQIEEFECGCGSYQARVQRARNSSTPLYKVDKAYSPSYDMQRYYGDSPKTSVEVFDSFIDAKEEAEEHISQCNCNGVA